jgi:hypothetical protein
MGQNASRPHHGILSDRYPSKDCGSGTDGRASSYHSGDTSPIRLRLKRAFARHGAGIQIINESHSVADEGFVFYGDPFANEGVA